MVSLRTSCHALTEHIGSKMNARAMLLQTAMKNERKARQMAEEVMTEREILRHKLKSSETSKAALEEKLQAMTHDARDWEVALDALQVRLLE